MHPLKSLTLLRFETPSSRARPPLHLITAEELDFVAPTGTKGVWLNKEGIAGVRAETHPLENETGRLRLRRSENRGAGG